MERSDEARREDSLYDRIGSLERCNRQQDEKIRKLEFKNKRLLSTLNYERPDKYPDNCFYCRGTNGGVKGNEQIVDNKIACDYCHAEIMQREENDGNPAKR